MVERFVHTEEVTGSNPVGPIPCRPPPTYSCCQVSPPSEALQEFLLHLQATRAANTCAFYQYLLRPLAAWATEQEIPMDRFGKRERCR